MWGGGRGGRCRAEIRSRCLRLADDSDEEVGGRPGGMAVLGGWASGGIQRMGPPPTLMPSLLMQARAVKALLAHRLQAGSALAAKLEW